MHLVALAHRDADGGVVDNVEMEEVGPEHVVEAEPATPAAAVQHQVVDSDVLGGVHVGGTHTAAMGAQLRSAG